MEPFKQKTSLWKSGQPPVAALELWVVSFKAAIAIIITILGH